jgi:hypothetical protein
LMEAAGVSATAARLGVGGPSAASGVLTRSTSTPNDEPTTRRSDPAVARSNDHDRNRGRGHEASSEASSGEGASQTGAHTGRTTFVSYVAVDAIDEADDDVSDSASYADRMHTESLAIDYILQFEPRLQRTAAGNPGFDLFAADEAGNPDRWVEVKAMVGTLDDRPVGLSRMQFLTAQREGSRYWLYIVELAKSERPRLIRIQDPAGRARTFTLDKGWREVAALSEVNVDLS